MMVDGLVPRLDALIFIVFATRAAPHCVPEENNRCFLDVGCMKPKSEYSFIDNARMGRTDWWAAVLTLLLVAFISILSNFIVLIFSGWSLYHNNFRIVDLYTSTASGVMSPVGIFGFWLACKTILRRPFLSLASVDLRFSVRRCLFGAGIFLPANLLALLAMSLYASMRYGTWMIPFGQFRLPNGSQVFAAISAIITFPFLAAAEELYFRGWLTQTLRQYLRLPLAVVAIVAAAFAAYHAQYTLDVKALLFAASFGLSALSLRDQRLELAVGAHSMLNICVALEMLFFTGLPHTKISVASTTFDGIFLVGLKGVLPFVLMYWFLQKTNSWFTLDHTANIADAQRV